jgi:NADH dehydrogenase FAD-containing subunit
MAWHVVIAGGGFGGFYAARTLERVLPRQSARLSIVHDHPGRLVGQTSGVPAAKASATTKAPIIETR